MLHFPIKYAAAVFLVIVLCVILCFLSRSVVYKLNETKAYNMSDEKHSDIPSWLMALTGDGVFYNTSY